ncbi:phosphate ABC transporter permease [Haloarcula halophila]|uniref:phosphate ABC transporter permease n=1 Tax=Haloarcula TaxID=2237 RepID=UPI0023E42820|nr:phosphate ABC transporter permease [Halomicroarcula sp. DFY41]
MSTHKTVLGHLPALPEEHRQSLPIAVVGIAAVAVAARFVAALAVNAPGAPSTVAVESLGWIATAIPALAAVVAGVFARRPTVGVGLLFVGVFGLLSLVSGAAAAPAAVAVVAGTVAVVVAARDRLSTGERAAGAVLLTALTVGLASGVGGFVGLRSVGSTLTLAGMGLSLVFTATDGRALIGGGLAFGAVVAVGLSVPFVTGAVTLVGGGVVGTPLPVVALAAAGTVSTASAAGRTRNWPLLAGVVLLALAGVPATVARAVPFALGIATLVSLEGSR